MSSSEQSSSNLHSDEEETKNLDQNGIDMHQEMKPLLWDVFSTRDDIPKITVKSNDGGILHVSMGCLVIRSVYFADFKFDHSQISMDFPFKELQIFFELMMKDVGEDKFNRDNALSLFRISDQYGVDDIRRRAFQFIVNDSDSSSVDLSFDLLIQYWLTTTKHEHANAKEDPDVFNRIQTIRENVLTRFRQLLNGNDRDIKRIIPDDPTCAKEFTYRLDALKTRKRWAYRYDGYSEYNVSAYYGDCEYRVSAYDRDCGGCITEVTYTWVKEARMVIEQHASMFLIEQTTDLDLFEIKNLFSVVDAPGENEFVLETQDRTLLCRILMSML